MKDRLKKVRQEAAALELEQGPRELQKEDPGTPQVRQISHSGAPEIPAGSHGHPETPAPTNSREKQERRAMKKAKLKKLREPDAALKLEAGGDRLLNTTKVTWSPAPAGARVRQSVLYSDRPRRSKRSTRVGEHVGEVSSREFEALTLDQSHPTPDSTHRFKECDIASSETESEVVVEEPEDESDFDLEEWRKLNEYKETMFDKDFTAQSATLAASCDKNSAVEHVTECSGAAEWAKQAAEWAKQAAEWAKRAYLTQNESLQAHLDAQRTMMASSRDEPRCEVSDEDMLFPNEVFEEGIFQNEVSDEDIIQNGNKWMSEEVMVAFDEYIRRIDELKELKYCFQELCHQCFNVECYFKIFHHFNFTVKMKLPSSDDWKLKTYFAEVKEIFGKKFYFCCPLEEKENGQCNACRNQGVDELRHPATGGFERGLPDTVFPYM